jgi:hypothetical protein
MWICVDMMQLRQSIQVNFQFGVILTHGMDLVHAMSDPVQNKEIQLSMYCISQDRHIYLTYRCQANYFDTDYQ